MSWLQRSLQTFNSNLLDAEVTTWLSKSFRYGPSSTQSQANEASTPLGTSFMKSIAHPGKLRRELRIRTLTTRDVRIRRSRFCSRTCTRRGHPTSTVVLNSATILESAFMKVATQKHIQEPDISNDVSLFIDKRQSRCQVMTTALDIWTRPLSSNDDDSRYLNPFISVSPVCSCETEISYFWYITLALALERTLLSQNNSWSVHRCETHLIEHFLMWNASGRSRCETFESQYESIVDRINQARWSAGHRARF